MSAPKAKGTTMVDAKLRKAKKKIEELEGQAAQLQMSIMNFRQMYEGSIGEKNVLQNRLANVEQLLTAAVVSSRGKTVTIKEKTFDTLSNFAGIDTQAVDGSLILTALTTEQVTAMQEDIDEA